MEMTTGTRKHKVSFKSVITNFLSFGAVEASCEHDTNISSFKLIC